MRECYIDNESSDRGQVFGVGPFLSSPGGYPQRGQSHLKLEAESILIVIGPITRGPNVIKLLREEL